MLIPRFEHALISYRRYVISKKEKPRANFKRGEFRERLVTNSDKKQNGEEGAHYQHLNDRLRSFQTKVIRKKLLTHSSLHGFVRIYPK